MKWRARKLVTVSITLCVALGLSACARQLNRAPTPITVQLKWLHNAQFAGFYAAEQKGYYAAEGLAVTFVEGGPGIDVLPPVLGGTAHLGVAGASELIPARAEGKPLHAIAALYRRNPHVYFALASSGVTRPQDFAGKQIRSVSDGPVILHAMMARVGIRRDQYTEVALPSDVALFASGQVPVWGAYLTALVLAIQRAGHQINIIYPDDYGVHFYGDVLFTTDDLIAKNPELVRRFLRATLKGWTYAVENPTAIGPMVARYKSDADPDLEVAQMTSSIPFVNTGEDHIGWMKPEVWAGMEKTLREQGVLTKPAEIEQVYSMQFLQEIYGQQ